MIFRRLEGQRTSRKLNRYLRLYFIAQDIHERVSASHYPYSALAETFFHHDVLFRCQRLLDQQGRACKRLAKALLLRQPFDHGLSEQALEDLRASIVYLRAQRNPAWTPLLRSLQALGRNLATLEDQLSRAHNPDMVADQQDASLFNRSPRSLKDAWERVRLNLTPGSPLFRHATPCGSPPRCWWATACCTWSIPPRGSGSCSPRCSCAGPISAPPGAFCISVSSAPYSGWWPAGR